MCWYPSNPDLIEGFECQTLGQRARGWSSMGSDRGQGFLPPSVSLCVWQCLTWPFSPWGFVWPVPVFQNLLTKPWWAACMLQSLVGLPQPPNQGTLLLVPSGSLRIVLPSFWPSPCKRYSLDRRQVFRILVRTRPKSWVRPTNFPLVRTLALRFCSKPFWWSSMNTSA